MTITLDLQPEIETGLLARAAACGVSPTDYVKDIVTRDVHISPEPPRPRTGQDLIDASARVRGLLTDEEVDQLFSRTPSSSRSVRFE